MTHLIQPINKNVICNTIQGYSEDINFKICYIKNGKIAKKMVI